MALRPIGTTRNGKRNHFVYTVDSDDTDQTLEMRNWFVLFKCVPNNVTFKETTWTHEVSHVGRGQAKPHFLPQWLRAFARAD